MSKSEKLYKDSPRVERDEKSGEVGITRPSEADKQDMGLSGNPLEGAGDGMKVDVQHEHEKMQDMLERHQAELKDMHKRHEKEHAKLSGMKDDKGEKTGEAKIDKVEKKKEN